MRDKFIDLWKSSALVQGLMALSCTATIIYLSVVGQDVPEVLVGIVMTVVGYYFGAKNRTS